jgi:acetyl-CoA synthetase
MSADQASSIESVLHEDRHFPPPAGFAAQAHVGSMEQYAALHKRSIEDPEGFWAEEAERHHWFKPWDKVLDTSGGAPDAKWFVGGKTNLCYNAVDKQVADGFGSQTAIIWEAEPIDADGTPQVIHYTYADLMRETAKFANVLKSQGVKKGDVVTIYMGMVPELAIAVLACARIGAPHSVIFGGFSAQAIKDRVEDGNSRIIVTCDGSWRRGSVVPLKDNVDEACKQTDLVDSVIVLNRCNNDVSKGWVEGRDRWYRDLMENSSDDCPCEELDAEDLAFILYTSGSTGKPKGIMHTTGGYMVWTAMTSRLTFDLQPDGYRGEGPRGLGAKGSSEDAQHSAPRPHDPSAPSVDDVYWCTADIGWITGHSYILYGILPNRVPTIMYEGGPNYPAPDRFWDMVERHKVTKFYTAPTAIRAFMKWGDEHPRKHDLSSLKVLGTVGEPINPEAWMWYHKEIGGERCPIVDTWWQTETGGHMLTPLPGATTTTPGSCCRPMIGVDAAVVNSDGEEVGTNEGGILVIRKPWPGMLRGIYGDRERYIDTYWSRFQDKGYYVPADGARVDDNGNFWIMGRIDDVIVVAGHNIGTMEVESAIVSHDATAEAAVVGYPHDVKGNALAAFIILKGDLPAPGSSEAEQLKKDIREHCGKELGPICKPDQVRFTEALPKTRSGKIMRRLLRDIAAGHEITQDVTTLEDKSIVEKLQASG